VWAIYEVVRIYGDPTVSVSVIVYGEWSCGWNNVVIGVTFYICMHAFYTSLCAVIPIVYELCMFNT
jgi:hypothetical protein